MAVTLWVFGALACVRLVSVPAIVVWTTAGPLLFALGAGAAGPGATARPWLSDWRAALRKPQVPLYALGLGLLLVVAGLRYANSVMNVSFNPWDDNMAYRSFIRQFLDTGTLTDGFSFRRVGAYGGISLLQAMVLAMTDRDRVHIMDNGICLLAAVGLITGYRGSSRSGLRAAPVLVAGLLFLTLPYYLHNLGRRDLRAWRSSWRSFVSTTIPASRPPHHVRTQSWPACWRRRSVRCGRTTSARRSGSWPSSTWRSSGSRAKSAARSGSGKGFGPAWPSSSFCSPG